MCVNRTLTMKSTTFLYITDKVSSHHSITAFQNSIQSCSGPDVVYFCDLCSHVGTLFTAAAPRVSGQCRVSYRDEQLSAVSPLSIPANDESLLSLTPKLGSEEQTKKKKNSASGYGVPSSVTVSLPQGRTRYIPFCVLKASDKQERQRAFQKPVTLVSFSFKMVLMSFFFFFLFRFCFRCKNKVFEHLICSLFFTTS